MHPEVIKKYKENGFEIALERAEDINETNFLEQVKASKQPVKREITKIIRVRKAGQEHFYYGEELTSFNYLGNKIQHYHTVGKYEDPVFRFHVNDQGKKVATEIESHETVYEYNWPNAWSDELESLVSETVDLLIITPGRKYGGFTYPQFKESSFDDLVTFGRFGTLNPVIINELKKKSK